MKEKLNETMMLLDYKGKSTKEATAIVTDAVVKVLQESGYSVRTEYPIGYLETNSGRCRNGKIDVVGIDSDSNVVAVEIDRSYHGRSIDKLVTIKLSAPSVKAYSLRWRKSENFVEEISRDTRVVNTRVAFRDMMGMMKYDMKKSFGIK